MVGIRLLRCIGNQVLPFDRAAVKPSAPRIHNTQGPTHLLILTLTIRQDINRHLHRHPYQPPRKLTQSLSSSSTHRSKLLDLAMELSQFGIVLAFERVIPATMTRPFVSAKDWQTLVKGRTETCRNVDCVLTSTVRKRCAWIAFASNWMFGLSWRCALCGWTLSS